MIDQVNLLRNDIHCNCMIVPGKQHRKGKADISRSGNSNIHMHPPKDSVLPELAM